MSDKNPFPNENNTGHIWDENLRELTNEPPKWWMIGFWAGFAFVIGYYILYPAIPLVNTYTKGVLGWTSTGEYHKGRQAIEEIRAPFESRIATMSVDQVLADSELRDYSVRAARVLFADNCAACHGAGGQGGSDAEGNALFPILADDNWLWGGTIDRIHETIAMGRNGNMPAHGHLDDADITELARHIMALRQGGSHPPGEAVFTGAGACFACHGMDAKGNIYLGAANLTTRIVRFGDGSLESIVHTIRHGVNAPGDPLTRTAEMPSFAGRLGESDTKKLAVYVHQFGGGQ